MFVEYDERPSDSPFVDKVWRSRSGDSGELLSVAASRVEIVIARVRSRTVVTVRGPETKPGLLHYPGDAEWVGIRFKLGAFLPTLLPLHLRDRQNVDLPQATAHSFWLNGSVFEYPTFDQAESLVARLTRHGDLVRDPNVEDALQGRQPERSVRSMQRHFLRATGLTVKALRHISRARQATTLLRSGVSILDVVRLAGYYDQAHLTQVAQVPHRTHACPDSASAHHAFAQLAASSAPDTRRLTRHRHLRKSLRPPRHAARQGARAPSANRSDGVTA